MPGCGKWLSTRLCLIFYHTFLSSVLFKFFLCLFDAFISPLGVLSFHPFSFFLSLTFFSRPSAMTLKKLSSRYLVDAFLSELQIDVISAVSNSKQVLLPCSKKKFLALRVNKKPHRTWWQALKNLGKSLGTGKKSLDTEITRCNIDE